jgi:hypothetical protein
LKSKMDLDALDASVTFTDENSLKLNPSYIQFVEFSSRYMLPSINGISFLFNLLILIIMLATKLKSKCYTYLKIKQAIIIIIGLILVFNTSTSCAYCSDKTSDSLMSLIYKIYFFRITLEISAFFLCTIEIKLTYDRFMILKNETNWITVAKNRNILPIFLAVSILAYSPEFFVYTIHRVETNSTIYYKLTLTEFGASIYYNFYYMVVSVVLIILSIPVYMFLILLVVKKYREFIRRRTSLLTGSMQNENRMTKLVMMTGFASVTQVIIFLAAACMARLNLFQKYQYYLFSIVLRFNSLFGVPLLFVANGVIILYYDTNLTSFLRRYFQKNNNQ